MSSLVPPFGFAAAAWVQYWNEAANPLEATLQSGLLKNCTLWGRVSESTCVEDVETRRTRRSRWER